MSTSCVLLGTSLSFNIFVFLLIKKKKKKFILAIFGMGWVFPFLVCQALLSWQEARVGKNKKKGRRAAPLYLFWTVWRERNRVAFDNAVFLEYRLKSFFICNFWACSNVYSGGIDRYSGGTNRSLPDFLAWMGYR